MFLWPFVISVIISFCATFLIHKVAFQLNVRPKNDYRRQQKGTITLWGGLGIYATLLVMYWFTPSEILKNILICASLLVFVGILDDCKELRAWSKFSAQFVAALVWLYLSKDAGNILSIAGIPSTLSIIIGVFWIVGLCNAFNLIDGTDGQCSVVGMLGFATLGFAFPELQSCVMLLVGAILGFLIWNKPPAKIYLGESGSTLLGFSLSILTLSAPVHAQSPILVILGGLFIAAFPLIDTLLAIFRRKVKGRPVFSGDKDHIHHSLQKIGLTKSQVLLVVSVVVGCGNTTAFTVFKSGTVLIGFIIAANSALLLCLVLFGVNYVKQIAAQKVSYLGKTILETHVQMINEDEVNSQCKKAVLIDLFPYYTELQNSGMPTIISFVKEISKKLNNSTQYSLYSVGSYSVAVLYKEEKAWTELEQEEFARSFVDIFSHFGVLRSPAKVPEGIYFYGQDHMHAILDMIHTSRSQNISYKETKVAA